MVITHFAVWYPSLPEQVPSKFSSSGDPVQYMEKQAFVVLMGFVQLITFVVTGGISFTIGSLPDSLINLPHKDYWLAEPQREESLRIMSSSLRWIAILTAWFLLILTHLSFMISVGKRVTTSPEFEITFVAYMTLVLGFIVWLFWRFRRPAFGDG
jgi:uncharacterized membrane protein